ncbi:uncharacterized protein LOC142784439 [Rhipicephalus microplus]|uniref:uncharacterized protein LOC142784439 n=1 Tax=Rhipicephalus microplus TaxID=6941 RepID=UPI003F6C0E17
MAFAGIAPPDPFLPTLGCPVQPWFRWHDMFKVYLLASGASEFSPLRRKALLLHSLGPEGQRIFNTLSISQAAEKTEEEGTRATPDMYDSAVAALAKHFDATCNLVVECHRFHRRIQFPGESIQEYETALTELATMCSLMSQEESLRDQFVAGLSSHRIRERLLLEGSSLSFNKAVALVSKIEQAAVEMKEFSVSVQPVSAQSGTKGGSSLQSPNSLPRARTFSQHDKAATSGNPLHLERALHRTRSNTRILRIASAVVLNSIALLGNAAQLKEKNASFVAVSHILKTFATRSGRKQLSTRFQYIARCRMEPSRFL